MSSEFWILRTDVFRIVLTTYLSLVMSAGPALCCCSLAQWLPFGKASGCCAKKVASQRDGHGGQCGHSRGHYHHQHDQFGGNQAKILAKTAKEHPQNQPADTDHSCPCGHKSPSPGMLSSGQASVTSVAAKSIVFGPESWASATPIEVSSDSHIAIYLAGVSGATLSGTEILRAYHIMRC